MKKNLSIRRKIILSFIILVISASCISGVFFFYTYYNTLKTNAYHDLDFSISNVQKTMKSNFHSLDNASLTFLSNDYIRKWTKGELDFDSSNPNYYTLISNMQTDIRFQMMFNDAWMSGFIDTVYIYANNECIPITSRLHVSQDELTKLQQNIYEQTKDFPLGTHYVLSKDKTPFLIRRIGNTSFTKNLTLIIAINSKKFAEPLFTLPENYTAHITDKEDFIYFSPISEYINTNSQYANVDLTPAPIIQNGYKTIIEGSTQLLVFREIPDTKFKITVSLPRSIITNKTFVSILRYFSIMATFLMIFLVISFMVVTAYTRFIKDLEVNLQQIRLRNYDYKMPIYKDKELNNISSTFNNMTTELKTLIEKVYKSELLLKDTEIQLLQSQMNPHFLVNTLTTISTKALLNNQTELYEMVSALNGLLSASLYNNAASFIKVKDELEYIRMYLYLQHIRFQDKLIYTIQIDSEDINELYIPRLSVEPIVENAVVHGLEDNIENGIVTINATYDRNDILFTITDNGKGFIIEDNFNSTHSSSKKGHNIGINNTNKRIKLLFGESYGITYDSVIDKGTKAYIRFPRKSEIPNHEKESK
ncbi:hypothetical protein SH2C18_38860 [Clostridium sediminicola]|uniref:sensor histidine kinase n=1 Tax=Clostridium sediminicola TaxID=3114879 RepID=UPI0031F26512